MKKNKLQKLGNIKTKHQAAIDEFFNNGFNGSKAVQSIYKNDITTARPLWNKINTKPENAEYIKVKRAALKRRATIENLQIVRELILFAYSDISAFIGLTPEQVKALPSDVTRTIQAFKHKKHSYIDRHGTEHEEETIEIKLIDKLKAIDIINKHIGFYEVDNKQKAARVNLNNLPNATINVLLKAMQAEIQE